MKYLNTGAGGIIYTVQNRLKGCSLPWLTHCYIFDGGMHSAALFSKAGRVTPYGALNYSYKAGGSVVDRGAITKFDTPTSIFKVQ